MTGDRKIIIFTEHRDTLEYLAERIRDLLGRPDAVVTIHGGVRREERRKVTELFAQDIDTRVLVATDAAGEGLNLQRAHLMVNYDLPWNPNRIEQRFGRIHRIGQTEVCHLWNLVADDTREGMVFPQLLDKIEEQRKAYQGKVFDVLGEAFEGQPLRDLLVEAIRYGNRPEVRARLHEIIDKTVGEGLDKLIAERAAHADIFAAADLEKWRARMDEATRPPPAAALHPRVLHGRVQAARRPHLRARVRPLRDPPRPRRHPRPGPADRHRAPRCCTRYERVTFDKELTRPAGKPRADLLAPGHPLLDAVTDLIIERYGTLLKQGTMLADRHDPGPSPGCWSRPPTRSPTATTRPAPITKRFGFAEITPGRRPPAPDGVRAAGEARYLDYEPLQDSERTVVLPVRDAPWLSAGVETIALDWAVTEGMPEELARTRELVTARVDQIRRLVRQRLTGEINYWDMRHADLLEPAVRGPPLEDEARDGRRQSPRPGTPPGKTPRRPGPRRGTDRETAGGLSRRACHPPGIARQTAGLHPEPCTGRPRHRAVRAPCRRRRPSRRTPPRPRLRRDGT